MNPFDYGTERIDRGLAELPVYEPDGAWSERVRSEMHRRLLRRSAQAHGPAGRHDWRRRAALVPLALGSAARIYALAVVWAAFRVLAL